jgi:hypothetical protein
MTMSKEFNPKRIRRAIKNSYNTARTHLAEARYCKTANYTLGMIAHQEAVAEIRKLNAIRRLALQLGRLVGTNDIAAYHQARIERQNAKMPKEMVDVLMGGR